jgi:hypothetical protein
MLLIDALSMASTPIAPSESALDLMQRDAADSLPVQEQPLRILVDALACQKVLKGIGLESQSPPGTGLRQLYPYRLRGLLDHLLLFLNPSYPRYFSCDDRLQLHGVQMPRLPAL